MAHVAAAAGKIVTLDNGVLVDQFSSINVDVTLPLAAAALTAGNIVQLDSAAPPPVPAAVAIDELTYSQIVANVPVTAVQAAIAGLSVNINSTGRPVKLLLDVQAAQVSAAGNTGTLLIMEGTTVLARVAYGNGSANELESIHREVRLTPSPGAHTYHVEAVGTGTIGANDQVVASLTSPGFLEVVGL